jgi:predicted enzyme related to lactoylglutathione lyase
VADTTASHLVAYGFAMTLQRLSPVFPVRDIDSAMAHYRKLGFAVREYEGPDGYAFAEREGIEIHLAEVADLKPRRNMSAVYLYVDDADALYEEWRRAGIDGRLVEPTDTSYGLREGACLDSDANLIRFGSGT